MKTDGKVPLTKEEFCLYTHTSENCWIFREVTPRSRFYTELNDEGNGYYCFDNGINTIRRFKDMPNYREVWISVAEKQPGGKTGPWSLWGTWTCYD